MSDLPRLFHNPRCSKSRAALALLTERGVAVTVVEYIKSPPDAATLTALLAALGDDGSVIRAKDAAAAGVGPLPGDRAGRVALLAAHPGLLERPILWQGERAVIGRPPEVILSLLG